MAKLILWDIDGTLTLDGRSAVRAYRKSLATTWEIAEEIVRIHTSGMTDDQIAFETLALYRLAEADVAAKLGAFRKTYADEVARTRHELTGDLVLLPGVPETLAALRERGVHQSLLTGNYEPVARIKLEVVGIADYLDLGSAPSAATTATGTSWCRSRSAMRGGAASTCRQSTSRSSATRRATSPVRGPAAPAPSRSRPAARLVMTWCKAGPTRCSTT